MYRAALYDLILDLLEYIVIILFRCLCLSGISSLDATLELGRGCSRGRGIIIANAVFRSSSVLRRPSLTLEQGLHPFPSFAFWPLRPCNLGSNTACICSRLRFWCHPSLGDGGIVFTTLTATPHPFIHALQGKVTNLTVCFALKVIPDICIAL